MIICKANRIIAQLRTYDMDVWQELLNLGYVILPVKPIYPSYRRLRS